MKFLIITLFLIFFPYRARSFELMSCSSAFQALQWDAVNGFSCGSMNVAKSFNNSPSHSIVTAAASANGFQISSTRDAFVEYNTLITTTSSIVAGQSGYIVLEIAATNSSVAGDWSEISRNSNAQTYSLAVAIQGIQPIGSTISGMIPNGYYARLRSVNVTGTPSFSYVSGQEVLL